MPWGELAHERPPWMRVRLRTAGSRYDELDGIVRSEGLHTVCEEARCPNIGECWGHRTATFMLLGDTCTRNCSFCAVAHGKPLAVDPHEPARVGEAVAPLPPPAWCCLSSTACTSRRTPRTS